LRAAAIMTFIRAEAGIGERQIQALGAEGEPDLAQLAGPDKAPTAGAAGDRHAAQA